MAITRDSKLLWLGFATAVVIYLSNSPNPMAWSYNEWLKAAAVLLAWASGKLATSPLKGA